MNITTSNITQLNDALRRSKTPWYARQVILLLQEIEHGCLLIELPNGVQITVGHGIPNAYLKFDQWQIFRDVLNKGDIGFAEEVLGDDDYYEVGMFEEKFIVIDRKTGEVRVEDDDEEGTIIFSCAETSEKFLDALWVAVRYFSTQLNEKLKDDDLESRELKAQQCADVAGGEQYFAFYQDFLNCYER